MITEHELITHTRGVGNKIPFTEEAKKLIFAFVKEGGPHVMRGILEESDGDYEEAFIATLASLYMMGIETGLEIGVNRVEQADASARNN
jgi:hypothetical protein